MSLPSQFLRRVLAAFGPGGSSLDTRLAQFDKELENFQSLERPAPESNLRTPFDSPHINRSAMSLETMTARQVLSLLPVMAPLMRQLRLSASLYDGSFSPTRSEVNQPFIDSLEALARGNGVKDIRYIQVPPAAIFQGLGIPHSYAVLITVEMDRDNLATAPSFAAFLEVAKGYKKMAVASNKIARFMRDHGYAAYPGTALGGLTDYIYLAELAGLGASGYHGLLIAPKQGARLRINAIYTNISNLSIEYKNDHLWLRDFCALCRKCIRECPVEAIFDQPQPRDDGGFQTIDHALCRDYFNQNYGCAICLITCPFSQYDYEKIKARFKGNPNAPQLRIPLPD